MCGRYSLTSPLGQLWDRFDLRREDLPHEPRYNVAPTDPVLTVLNDGSLHGEMARWGLVPRWAKDVKISARMINARAETLAANNAFREPLRTRRCLVLADGFYEWRREGKSRVPFRLVLSSREPFAFAGLWDEWRAPTGETLRSCTIVTTSANPLVARIHDRMPVILPQKAEALWMDQSLSDPKALTWLLVPYPAEQMDAYAVSHVVNSVKNDVPECVTPVGP